MNRTNVESLAVCASVLIWYNFSYSIKKWATPTGSCLPIVVFPVSKQCKTARSIRAISYSIKNPKFRKGIWDFCYNNIKINLPYFHLEILHRRKDRILFREEKILRRRRIFSCFASVFREIHEAKREPPRPERRQ